MNLLGATRLRNTAYHPQANGLFKRFLRHLKTGLKACLAGSNLVDDLPIVLLGICATLKDNLSCTSAEMVYGTTILLPGDFSPHDRGSLLCVKTVVFNAAPPVCS